MIRKLLIANRGEIACRIIRTCRRLGIATIAVYSDADRDTLHVEQADEAVHIGPAPVTESYLRGDAIIEAALRTGADAIHPGYGFLSENAAFAEAVTAAGLRFVGPSAAAIRAMGLKDAAKALMEKSGVPVVPGYHGESQDPDLLLAEAERIGFPVLIKARAGGGGKGMRRVDDNMAFRDALSSAQREALAAFGDEACLIEKYVTHPRHIEIQVFGDDHGHAVYLFERDCSLQRRHQKVIEEAPAPGMSEEMRYAMGEAAVRAARAIGYSGAGTIEFIADASEGLKADRFWFMEMNTRLQVEHPVTEAITGIDLVEWQLRVASGEALPLRQEDLAINGWAMEARLYAEDAGRGFLPSTGTLTHLHLPEDLARIDSGVRTGDRISPFYDPMIAKIIVHAPDRATALARLAGALDNVRSTGVATNAAFLRRLAEQPDFAAGRHDTGLIERDLGTLTESRPAPDEIAACAALVLSGMLEPGASLDPWDSLSGFRLWGQARHFVTLHHRDQHWQVSFASSGDGTWSACVDGRILSLTVRRTGETWRLTVEGVTTMLHIVRDRDQATIFRDGDSWSFDRTDPLDGEHEATGGGDQVVAPMPGLLKVVCVSEGQAITAGRTVAVMEAMKMELALAAPRDGKIAQLLAAEGEQVQEGAVILLLEPEDE
nr:acetyl/propionyl/methylcrotonyl-CoA carboxylase subunit alpha [Rhizobium sp. Q54]